MVLAASDSVPEPGRKAQRPSNSLGDAAGNLIALDMSGDDKAFYEHLAAGLRGRVGQSVRRGDVIGYIRSTGDTMSAHQHFHIATRFDPMAADGLLYAAHCWSLLPPTPPLPGSGLWGVGQCGWQAWEDGALRRRGGRFSWVTL